MRIGILGGTFDPIHNAHLYIGYEAKIQLNLDKVIFVPAGIQPFKQDKKITDGALRYEMIKKALEVYEGLQVSDYEINRSDVSYTYKTLQHFKDTNEKDTEIFFITGADCLMTIETWMEAEKIFSLCNLVVFMRGGANKNKLLEKKKYLEEKHSIKVIFLDLNALEISSSDIRERIKNNRRIDFFVPQSVKKIIYDKNLYME